jgi:hypothetical protein
MKTISSNTHQYTIICLLVVIAIGTTLFNVFVIAKSEHQTIASNRGTQVRVKNNDLNHPNNPLKSASIERSHLEKPIAIRKNTDSPYIYRVNQTLQTLLAMGLENQHISYHQIFTVLYKANSYVVYHSVRGLKDAHLESHFIEPISTSLAMFRNGLIHQQTISVFKDVSVLVEKTYKYIAENSSKKEYSKTTLRATLLSSRKSFFITSEETPTKSCNIKGRGLSKTSTKAFFYHFIKTLKNIHLLEVLMQLNLEVENRVKKCIKESTLPQKATANIFISKRDVIQELSNVTSFPTGSIKRSSILSGHLDFNPVSFLISTNGILISLLTTVFSKVLIRKNHMLKRILKTKKEVTTRLRNFQYKKKMINKFLSMILFWKRGGKKLSNNMLKSTSLPKQITRLVQERLETLGEKAPKQTTLSPLRIFGAHIGALRRKRGLTLEQLSEMTSIDTKTLLSIECGFLKLEQVTQNLPAISKALGEDPQALMRFFFSLL